MSDRLIPLEEAAKMLGISTEELSELRSQNEVFGYRDGAGWKFKRAELERFADERGVELIAVSEELSTDSDLIEPDGASDIDLGSEGLKAGGSSNVLSGDSDKMNDPAGDTGKESFADEEDDEFTLASSDVDIGEDLIEGGSVLSGDSNKNLEPASDTGKLGEISASSDIDVGEEELTLDGGSSNVLAGSDADLSDSKKMPSDTGKMLEMDQEELLLAEDDLFVEEDELRLEEDSDEISLGPDSEISSDFEDSDLVIESEAESEVELDTGDSGLTLSATDSGIALDEEPLELGGSDIDSLELPEDDELITLEEPSFEEAEADDDFMLTPVETLPEDDDSSGSQVIALEDSEIYDSEDSSGISIEPDAFTPDSSGVSGFDSGYDEGVAGAVPDAEYAEDPYAGQAQPAMMGAMGEPVRPTLVQAPYSIWNVLALMCVVGFMGLGGMLVFDFFQHIQHFEEPKPLTQNVMNFVIGMVDVFKGLFQGDGG